jgi:chloramphenicol 3-O phosphotransferase
VQPVAPERPDAPRAGTRAHLLTLDGPTSALRTQRCQERGTRQSALCRRSRDQTAQVQPDVDRSVRDAAASSPILRPHLNELEVLSAQRNGERLDAEVTANGRRWWLVRFGEKAPEIFERPAVASVPAEGGMVVVLNGVSSAGKSSVVRAVVESPGLPWVGFDEPFFGIVRPDVLIWPEQSPSVWSGFLAGIAALAAQGNRVIAASGGLPYLRWRDAVADAQLLSVALDCPIEVLAERHRSRRDRRGGLIHSTTVHDGWEYDQRFDSSQMSPLEIAAAVHALAN